MSIRLIVLWTFLITSLHSLAGPPDRELVKKLLDKQDWTKLESILLPYIQNEEDVHSANLLVRLATSGYVKSSSLALKILDEKSSNGDATSSKNLGNYYYHKEKNLNKAYFYYQLAASNGRLDVIAVLISISVHRRNIIESYKWALIGKIRGLDGAKTSLSDLSKYIRSDQKEKALSLAGEWLVEYFSSGHFNDELKSLPVQPDKEGRIYGVKVLK